MNIKKEGFEWWAEYLGRHLTKDGEEPTEPGLLLPTRTKKGVADMRIGCIDVQYAISEDHAHLVGRIEMPSTANLTVVPAETHSGLQYVASWLIREAKAPFMVGIISLANPARSMEVTWHGSLGVFCRSGGSFTFDLGRLRAADDAFAGFNWKTQITPALYLARDARMLSGDLQKTAKNKLMALFAKTEGLAQAITSVDIQAKGGEHTLLGWSKIEKKA